MSQGHETRDVFIENAMKRLLVLTSVVVMVTLHSISAQPATPLSDGFYRVGYASGTDIRVSRDHITHSPVQNRIDMSGINDSAPYVLVAAADGIIEYIEDSNSASCSDTLVSCSDCNNYVWISHANGEWTKYSHFQTGSVTATGLQEGDPVTAGTVLGWEGDVGLTRGSDRAMIACTGDIQGQAVLDSINNARVNSGLDSLRTSVHLHFEVAIPDDITAPFDTLGGFINGVNLIPLICNIPQNIYIAGDTLTVGDCASGDCFDQVFVPTVALDGTDVAVIQASELVTTDAAAFFTIDGSASVVFHAGKSVELKPGFHAMPNSYFRAEIGECNTTSAVIDTQLASQPVNPLSASRRKKSLTTESTNTLEVSSPDTVAVANAEAIPDQYELMPNYPNPFNPTTTIRYALPKDGHVTIKIFDILGQEVRSLISEWAPAGYHQIVWDGSSNAGQGVASGQYFFRMTAGTFAQTNRMLLME